MSEARNNETFATSFALPFLLSGILWAHSSILSFPSALVISVSIKPGAIELHLIFLDPSSRAVDFVNPLIAAFEAE